MNKKALLGFMAVVVPMLAFMTASSILTGCAGKVPPATTYVQTATFTKTPTATP
jgi:hypothetical protein